MRRLATLPALLLALLLPPLALADATVPKADIAGAKDPAWLKRYEGSFIVSREFRRFDAVAFPASKLIKSEDSEDRDAYNNLVHRAKQVIKAEGEYTRLVYIAPEERSPLEVLRNYTDEVEAAGGKVVWQCVDKECGGDIHGNDHGGGWQGLMEQIYPQNRMKDEAFSNGSCATGGTPGEQQYALATIPVEGGGRRVLGLYAFAIQTSTYCKALNGRTGMLVVAVDEKLREKKMVTVSAGDMAKALDADGRIALYGITFDTDRSTIRAESKDTIAQIAALLKQQPKLELDVVGHTDNAGGAEHNRKLSQRRADAVVVALVEDHGIDEARLHARGEGMDKPVGDNATDAGRAKNRRVELVKR